MPTKTEAIANMLEASTHPDLAELYNINMEVQVNVAQGEGERVEGNYLGRTWVGWTDGLTTWKRFRIPHKANTDPEYQDSEIKFDLALHAEGIGLTGWDWYNKCSKWVGYDFDSLVNHKQGLTSKELTEIVDAVRNVDWVTIRKSTSGTGYHLFVFLDEIETNTHTEHAALARAILGQLSAMVGYDFKSKVDACGGVMWFWHRKMKGTDGLTLIKQGGILKDVPKNWKDHLQVVKGSRRKNLPKDITGSQEIDVFESISSQRSVVELDEQHKALINYLEETNALWWWDSDNHMLVTHTHYLQQAQTDLNLKGCFNSTTGATNLNEQNCFAFPMRKGAWSIRRYSQGVQEHDSWHQDAAGWTKCYLNKEPDLWTACRTYGGLENEKGEFHFREAEMAVKAAALLGVDIVVDTSLYSRECTLKQHKDGRLVAVVERKENDTVDKEKMTSWLAAKGKYTQVFNTRVQKQTETETGNYDDVIRHLVSESGEDSGWVIKSDGNWRFEPLYHLKLALTSEGIPANEVNNILGSSVFKPWKLVNKPFQPEYPGDREWNLKAAQLRFTLKSDDDILSHPTWDKILHHCGTGLDTAVASNGWCKSNGILNGGEYLKCWVASLFQHPMQPLPYLFFWGPQDSGKSVFHESLSTLLTSGYKRADEALKSAGDFNGELEGAIICVVEEVDLSKQRAAYNKIKDWVTAREINIHIKGKTPYHTTNSTHWIQCANDATYCPVFEGDTRITMSYVKPLSPMELIPRKQLDILLEKEAADFLTSIMKLELSESNSRLNIPVLESDDKKVMQRINQSDLETFMGDHCVKHDGMSVKLSDFYDRFIEWIDPNEASNWSKIRIGKELDPHTPKGRLPSNHVYIGNLRWKDDDIPDDIEGKRYILKGDKLELIDA